MNFPETFQSGKDTYVCTRWTKGSHDRIYIKFAGGNKDWLYYDANTREFAALRTFNAPGHRQELENAFLAAYLALDVVETSENAETVGQAEVAASKNTSATPKPADEPRRYVSSDAEVGGPSSNLGVYWSDVLGDDYDEL